MQSGRSHLPSSTCRLTVAHNEGGRQIVTCASQKKGEGDEVNPAAFAESRFPLGAVGCAAWPPPGLYGRVLQLASPVGIGDAALP